CDIDSCIALKALSGRNRSLTKVYLEKTVNFSEQFGGKTIICARFVPIIRTLAPFVAGVGSMSYGKFASYNVIGAIVWVSSFFFIGYFFGGLPVIKDNFTLVVFGIIILSVLPPLIEVIREKYKKRQEG